MATENKKYIPTLRFPEFQNDGEWSMLELGKFAKIVMGQSPSSEAYNERGEGVPLLQGNADIKDRHQVVRVYTTDITKTCDINDIIMTVRAPVGTISRASFKSCIGRGVCAIKTDSEYLYQYLISIEQEWDKLASGSTFVSITSNQIFDRIIFVPLTIQEQKKIADCLSSLDKYIDATKRKLELLKEHKKGLMQRLLPAKGKTTPEIRFPEFQNDGEWKIVLLKDFTEHLKSKVGNARLRPVSISAGIGFVDQKNKFGRDISGNQYSNYIELKKGEFAYNKGNSIKYPQGCVYQLKEFDIVACPNVFVCFRIITNDVYPDFISAYFASNYHGKQLQQHITSGVRSNGLLNISAETFLGIRIPLPSVSEQKKIADCLSSLDKYIDETSCKLEQLKGHKNGLMQQLFPKL